MESEHLRSVVGNPCFLCMNSTRSKCRSKWGAGQITYPILTGYYFYTKIPDFFGNLGDGLKNLSFLCDTSMET